MTTFVRVSPRDGRYLELTDGTPYLPIGVNSAWLNDAWAAEILGKVAANGGNFVRTFAASPVMQPEKERSGVFDPGRRDLLGRVLAQARALGVRVKITVEQFRRIEGEGWDVMPLHHRDRGGAFRTVADFLDSAAGRDQYRGKLAWFAEAFRDEPAVFAWELWNEMETVSSGDWLAWTRVMLPELRARFPRHLALQSLGSFSFPAQEKNYGDLARMPGLDCFQVHRYIDLGAPYAICHGPVDLMLADAVRRLRSLDPRAPILVAEAGGVEPNHSGPFALYDKDRDGTILHDVLFAPFFAGAAGPGHVWPTKEYVHALDLWRHLGRFAKAVEGLDPPAEGFEAVTVPHPRLRVLALAGKRTWTAWLRDGTNDWRTELAGGRAPEPVRGATLPVPAGWTAATRARAYDPWADRWTDLPAAGEGYALPDFTRSLVVRLERSSTP